jgi:hypothetical protein
VPFGVIRGITEGLMGLEADARTRRISTLYRHDTATTSSLFNVPLLGITLSVIHRGGGSTQLTNSGKRAVLWRARFGGNATSLHIGQQVVAALHEILPDGQTVVYAEVEVPPGKKVIVSVEKK